MKNKDWIWIVISIAIFAGSLLLVQYTGVIPGSKGNRDWLSFWGSYLGIIPSGLVAYLVAKLQIDQERHDRREEEYKKHRLQFQVRSTDFKTLEKFRLVPMSPNRFDPTFEKYRDQNIIYPVKRERGKVGNHEYANIKNVSENPAIVAEI